MHVCATRVGTSFQCGGDPSSKRSATLRESPPVFFTWPSSEHAEAWSVTPAHTSWAGAAEVAQVASMVTHLIHLSLASEISIFSMRFFVNSVQPARLQHRLEYADAELGNVAEKQYKHHIIVVQLLRINLEDLLRLWKETNPRHET